MISITAVKALRRKKAVRMALVAVFWLAVWQAACLMVREELLLVSPWRVLCRLLELACEKDFWLSAAGSMLRIISGFFLSVAVGTLLTVAASAVPFLRELFQPVISVIQATPVASFIILALVWLKSPQVPAFASFLMVLPIIWANVGEGIRKTDAALLEMACVYRFGLLGTIRHVYFPSVMPYFTAACTAGMGLAWKAGVAAEVLANSAHSIGGHIYSAKIYLETVDLFSWTVLVILLSVILEHSMKRFMHAVTAKYAIPVKRREEESR